MTASDEAMLRAHFMPCWDIPFVEHPENHRVVVRISVNRDGYVTDAITSPSQPSDPIDQALAESALRAVQNPACQPLHYPPGKYWPTLDFVFDLEKAINGG